VSNIVNSLTSVEQHSIRTKRVEHAMRTVDRAKYCHDFTQNETKTIVHPYHDAAMPIPFNATISAPHMVSFIDLSTLTDHQHALCLEVVIDVIETKLVKHEKINVLDVGSGSGYVTACLTHMILYQNTNPQFNVYGIDHIPSLVEISKMNMESDEKTRSLLQDGTITLSAGDGFAGLPEQGPFDIIHIGAACENVPEALFEQLAIGGRMVLPLGDTNFYQALTVISKNEKGEKLVQPLGIKCRFVPLMDANTQLTKAQTHRKPRVFQTTENDRMVVMPFIVSAQDGGLLNVNDIKWDTADDL
jgi:protein-L-isoaspartate(D-aspartate) O-methyltransferase